MDDRNIDYYSFCVRRRQVIRIAECQWWLCYYCGLPLDLGNLSRDHKIPKAEGGKGNNANIVASCTGCNKRKGTRDAPPERYIRLRQLAHYKKFGLRSTKPRGKWVELFPGFGTDLDGKPLRAPQFGII